MKRPRKPVPSFRTELVRRANDLSVRTEDLDRALVIGQIAGLLVRDRQLRGKLAHKGAAVLRLVENSERLSRDLDSAEIRGQRVDVRLIRAALTADEARKVVVRIDQVTPPSRTGVALLLHCRPLRGGPAMGITLSINWSEPLILKPVMATYKLPDGAPIEVPVMHRAERTAEKVRAFLTRGEASDAWDLWWYWTRVLDAEDRKRLPRLIAQKLQTARLTKGSDLHQRFDEMRENARSEWEAGTGLVIAGTKPDWAEVDRTLTKFKASVPQKLR